VRVRPATLLDLPRVAALAHALWPDAPEAELAHDFGQGLAGGVPGGLPWTLLVAEADGAVVGFLEVGLRSHADGCDPARPVGYLEGWYVEAVHRRRGLGRRLVAAAEAWARAQGCTELASDTWLDATASQAAHAALGFEEVDRCVLFRKALDR
jgi:aminoglycoside 6'-N-acetyltransferase I